MTAVPSALRIALVLSVAVVTFACSSLHGNEPGDAATGDDASDNGVAGGGGGGGGGGLPEGGGTRLGCASSGGICFCSVTQEPGAPPACSPASLGVNPADVVCCADPNYPANGSCQCQWIGCATANGRCTCGPQYGEPGGSCAADDWTCCVQENALECICAGASCQADFVSNGSACGITDLRCAGVARKVPACN
jgi:hypothetical protein